MSQWVLGKLIKMKMFSCGLMKYLLHYTFVSSRLPHHFRVNASHSFRKTILVATLSCCEASPTHVRVKVLWDDTSSITRPESISPTLLRRLSNLYVRDKIFTKSKWYNEDFEEVGYFSQGLSLSKNGGIWWFKQP